MYNWTWIVIAFFSAIAVMAVAAAGLLLQWKLGAVILALGLVTFVIVLSKNPAFWQRRVAEAVLGAWLARSVASSFSLVANIGDNALISLLPSEAHWSYHLVVCIVVTGLLLLDYKKTIGFAGSLNNKAIGADVELAKAMPYDERSKIALQILQEKSEFFSIDSSKLNRSDQFKLATQQIKLVGFKWAVSLLAAMAFLTVIAWVTSTGVQAYLRSKPAQERSANTLVTDHDGAGILLMLEPDFKAFIGATMTGKGDKVIGRLVNGTILTKIPEVMPHDQEGPPWTYVRVEEGEFSGSKGWVLQAAVRIP